MRFGYPECDRRSVRPPSTVRTWAVMKLASSLARNSTAAAMSSGSPSRPRSVRLTVASITWAGKAEIKSVRMKPGQMALTLMPWDLRSSATRFVRPMIAALLTAYGVEFAALEPIPAVEDKLIIFPVPALDHLRDHSLNTVDHPLDIDSERLINTRFR